MPARSILRFVLIATPLSRILSSSSLSPVSSGLNITVLEGLLEVLHFLFRLSLLPQLFLEFSPVLRFLCG